MHRRWRLQCNILQGDQHISIVPRTHNVFWNLITSAILGIIMNLVKPWSPTSKLDPTLTSILQPYSATATGKPGSLTFKRCLSSIQTIWLTLLNWTEIAFGRVWPRSACNHLQLFQCHHLGICLLQPKNPIFCLLFKTHHLTEVKDNLRVIRLHLEKLFNPCICFLLHHDFCSRGISCYVTIKVPQTADFTDGARPN